jgi:hypothetical protein
VGTESKRHHEQLRPRGRGTHAVLPRITAFLPIGGISRCCTAYRAKSSEVDPELETGERTMTWAEFKAAVEAAGVKDDDKIYSIEIGGWNSAYPVEVERGVDDSVWVHN